MRLVSDIRNYGKNRTDKMSQTETRKCCNYYQDPQKKYHSCRARKWRRDPGRYRRVQRRLRLQHDTPARTKKHPQKENEQETNVVLGLYALSRFGYSL